jgi:hypothetical protein
LVRVRIIGIFVVFELSPEGKRGWPVIEFRRADLPMFWLPITTIRGNLKSLKKEFGS